MYSCIFATRELHPAVRYDWVAAAACVRVYNTICRGPSRYRASPKPSPPTPEEALNRLRPCRCANFEPPHPTASDVPPKARSSHRPKPSPRHSCRRYVRRAKHTAKAKAAARLHGPRAAVSVRTYGMCVRVCTVWVRARDGRPARRSLFFSSESFSSSRAAFVRRAARGERMDPSTHFRIARVCRSPAAGVHNVRGGAALRF